MTEVVGASFLDRAGQRWWVRGRRPNSADQLVVEAELGGSYSRVALYVMSENEFRARAQAARATRGERPGSARRSERPAGERP